LITNTSAGDARARLDVSVVYSNGTVQRMSGTGDPGVLGPGNGYQVCVFFIVPADASLGTAQFTCTGSGAQRSLHETQVSVSTFDVVP
jgi:hypothetical protein